MPRGDRAPGARRAVRPPLARPVPATSTTTPAAAASIGQVHRAVWADGREVAVKLQYPGAGPALMADFTQLTRFAWLFGRISPGLDVKPLLAELKERVLEELDYTLEADAQRAFAAAYADDPRHRRAAGRGQRAEGRSSASGWTARRCRAIIAERHAGRARPRRLAAGPAALLGARRAPGCCTPTRTRATSGMLRRRPARRRRLRRGGPAARRLPAEPLGRLTRLAVDGDAEGVLARDARARVHPARHRGHRPGGHGLPRARPPTRCARRRSPSPGEWMRGQAARLGDPRSEEARVGRLLNLPPYYLLIHRVTLGSIGVLCQLGPPRRTARSPSSGSPASPGTPMT